MNYIILNNQISTNIPGLLIQELPTITKPLIRTQIEEIDGRDGDIVTPLGYAAYDKEIKIGLYGNFDIDKIIAYFNSSGTVTFSNEEDKYYNYEIIDKIDFERLIRFRTATVKFHVQPFKYSITDNNKSFTVINNLIVFNNYIKNQNGLNVALQNGNINLSGRGITGNTEIFLPITPLTLQEGDYTLTAETLGTNASYCIIRLIENNPINTETFGGNALTLADDTSLTQTDTIDEETTYNYLWLSIDPNVDIDFSLNISLENNFPTNEIIIRNNGNIYSKPILTLEATGTIELYLNGIAILGIDLGGYTSITIDTALMEAYNGSILLNRLVTGDYSNLKFNVGKNVLSWVGNVTGIDITNYSRWI